MRLADRGRQVLAVAEDAERRIGLVPLRLVVQLAFLVGGIEMADDARVGAGKPVVDQLRHDVLGIVALRRDGDEQRLLARAERGVEHVIEDRGSSPAPARHRSPPTAKSRAWCRPRATRRDRPSRCAAPIIVLVEGTSSIFSLSSGSSSTIWRGELVDDRRLVAVVGGGIDFAVGDRLRADQMGERQGGDQRGLAVLPRDREDRPPHRPLAVAVRLVDVADEPLLPRPSAGTACPAPWPLGTVSVSMNR